MNDNGQRTKLIIGVVTLVIAVTLVAAATYAWFSISKAPELKTISMHVENSVIFEIAAVTPQNKLNGPDEVSSNDVAKNLGQGAWGSSVELASESILLQGPATYDSELGLSTVAYDIDGRTNGFTALIKGEPTSGGISRYFAAVNPGEWYINEDGNAVRASQSNYEDVIGPASEAPSTTASNATYYMCAGGPSVWMRCNTSTGRRVVMKGLKFFTYQNGQKVTIASDSIIRTSFKISKLASPGDADENVRLKEIKSAGFDSVNNVAELELFSGNGTDVMESGKTYMLEIICYVEGDLSKNQNAVLAQDLDGAVRIGIEEMSFEVEDEASSSNSN